MALKITGTAIPGRVWTDDCECREVLIDHVLGTVHHPFFGCPHYGHDTPLERTSEL